MCLRSDRVLPGHVWLQRQSRGRAGPEERRNCRGAEKGRLVCYVLFFFPFVDTFLTRLCSLKQGHKILRGSHSSPVAAELSSRSSGQTGRVTWGKMFLTEITRLFTLLFEMTCCTFGSREKLYKNNLFCFLFWDPGLIRVCLGCQAAFFVHRRRRRGFVWTYALTLICLWRTRRMKAGGRER